MQAGRPMGQKLMIRHSHVGAVAVVALCLLSFIKQQKVMIGIFEQPPSSSPSQKQKQRLIRPKIYNVDEMPQIASSGPYVLNPSLPGRNMSGGKGLYQFDDVCLTKHFKTQAIQGLIYLEPKNEKLVNKIYRCVPCSRPLHHDGGWWGVGRDQNSVGHICGFQGSHAMFAANVSDLSACMQTASAQKKFKAWDQWHTPSQIKTIHYFEEPTLSLNFQENIGHSLFDYMLSYLPHWYEFRRRNAFPFVAAMTRRMPDCLTNHTFWLCEIIRAMDAAGGAVELPPEPDDSTLYCFKTLVVTHLSIQRTLSLNPGLLTKEVFDKFRDILFDEFHLLRARNVSRTVGEKDHTTTRNATRTILFYAHEPSGRRVWHGMQDLIEQIKGLPKYTNIEFESVHDFGKLPIQGQASLFNKADVIIMTHGAQSVNSIFSVDGTLFVELGCNIPVFIGNPKFMDLIGGHHMYVQKCRVGSKEDDICVICPVGGDHLYNNFTMNAAAFEKLIDLELRSKS